MRRIRIKDTKITLRIIGWIELIGGILGLYDMAGIMLQTSNINGAIFLIFITGTLLFLYSIYCGKKILTEPVNQFSIVYSIINYIPQVLQWYFLSYGFTYSSGIEINAGAQKSEFIFNAGITSDFAMSINTNDSRFLKINLFALAVLLILFDIISERKKMNNEMKKQQEDHAISASPKHL